MSEEAQNNVNVRLLIPARLSGGLIGKGGSIIKGLRQDSGASLDIASNVPNAPNRVLTAKGTKEAVVSGIVMIANRLTELANKQDVSQDVNLVFVIANSQVGCILGRAGAVIKSIREDSRANLKMSDQPLPGSTDKTLTVKGDQSQVETAVDRICEQLDGYTSKPNPRYPEIPYTPKPMGLAGMPPFPGVQNGAGPGPGAGRSGAYAGFPPQQPPQQQPYGAAPYGFPPTTYGGFTAPELKLKWLIPIEEHHVGSVIGKGGSNIQDIRYKSGALIKLEAKSEDGKEERHIAVTGTRQQNDIAAHMIFKKIAAYDPEYQNTRGGGGGGGRPVGGPRDFEQ